MIDRRRFVTRLLRGAAAAAALAPISARAAQRFEVDRPFRTGAELVPTAVTVRDRNGRLVTDLVYRVEVSQDLQTWHWNGDIPGAVWTIESGTEPRDVDSQWVTVVPAAALANEANLYFRLRADLPAQLAATSQQVVQKKPAPPKRRQR